MPQKIHERAQLMQQKPSTGWEGWVIDVYATVVLHPDWSFLQWYVITE